MHAQTVLIVDDHDGFRSRIRRLLELEGYVVVGEAVNGITAVSEAARLAPDIALVDVRLPDIDGFEVSVRLRAAGSAGSIVLTSTRQRADHGDRFASCGADGFIEKSELSRSSIDAVVRAAP